MLSLVLAALFFVGIHLGIAGTAIRDRAIGLLGKNGYMAAFAVASLIGLGWLVAAYNRAPYLITWGMLEWWKPIVIILMLPATLLVVFGLTTPNPTSVAQEGTLGQPPRGIVRVTRHPFLTGVGLWALLHRGRAGRRIEELERRAVARSHSEENRVHKISGAKKIPRLDRTSMFAINCK